MPYKNKQKKLYDGCIYHAYNRGYRKGIVFHDDYDYRKFLHYIRIYLDPKYLPRKEDQFFDFEKNRFDDNYKLHRKVELIAYCLMSNHFHLVIKSIHKYGMSDLIARVSSRYTRFYNQKYSYNGRLWADTYKAVEIKNREQLKIVINYIHNNPNDIGGDIYTYPYSSLKYYLRGYSNKIFTRGSSSGPPVKNLWRST